MGDLNVGWTMKIIRRKLSNEIYKLRLGSENS